MVRMSLKLVEKVVGESLRRIPAVPDGYLFVFSIWEFLSSEAVMLHIVNGLEVEDGKDCFSKEEDSHIEPVNGVN